MDENRLGTSTCTVQYEHTHERTHRCIEGVGGGCGGRGEGGTYSWHMPAHRHFSNAHLQLDD